MVTKKNIIRIVIVIAWILMLGALLKRDYFIKSLDIHEQQILQKGREESFSGIYFQDERIGYVKNRLVEQDTGDFILQQDAYMLLNILEESHPVDLRIKATLSNELLLKNFDFHFTSPFYRMDAKGEVVGKEIRFTLTTGKETINDVIKLAKPPFLSTNRRGYLLQQGLKEGDKLKIPYFDPISLSGKDTVMEYRGIEKKLIKGRVYQLHHFVETFSGVRINSWLDDEGKVIMEESPAGFIFIAEPEFKATDITATGKEILSSVSVPVTGTMPDPEGRQQMTYKLTLPPDGVFDLDRDRQSLQDDNILTIQLEQLPSPEAISCAGPEEELASTPYIQSRNSEIDKVSRSLVSEVEHPLEKVRILADWVFENLEKRPVLGIPDALTTLSTRIGDCNEHAALFAALARNASVPTRVVSGVTFHEGAFYYHAWNEVCLDDRWYSLDTTKDQFPADVSHIKFVEGETKEQIRISALLGKLQVEVLEAGAGDQGLETRD